MSTRDILDEATKEYGGSRGGIFQFKKSGTYILRILTKPVALATHFFGAGQKSCTCFGKDRGCPFHTEKDKDPSVKFVTYLINRADGKITLGEIPWSVLNLIGDWEKDEDYSFDGYPMPYNIKVIVDKENADPKQIYKALPSPKRGDLTPEEQAELATLLEKQTPEQYVQKRKDAALAAHASDGLNQEVDDGYPTENRNPEDIPF